MLVLHVPVGQSGRPLQPLLTAALQQGKLVLFTRDAAADVAEAAILPGAIPMPQVRIRRPTQAAHFGLNDRAQPAVAG